jgi:hypothetical protein
MELVEVEAFVNTDSRKLQSLALNPSLVFLLSDLVEESEDEHTKALFAEALNSKEEYFILYAKSAMKADEILDEMDKSRGKKRKYTETLDEVEDEIPLETIDDKLNKLLDELEEVPTSDVSKYLRLVNKNKSLAVAHTKLNEGVKDCWKKLKMTTKEAGKSVNNAFSKDNPKGTREKDFYITRVSKVFHIKDMGDQLRERVNKLFQLDSEFEDGTDDEKSEVENEFEKQSQDFPNFTQSKTSETLRKCKNCNFSSRDKDDMKDHEDSHPKCCLCGIRFPDDRQLERHVEAEHGTFTCDVCAKDINMKEKEGHVNSHKYDEAFEEGVKKGRVAKMKKVAKTKDNGETEKKKAKVTGYGLFRAEKMALLKGTLTGKGVLLKAVNEEWARAKADGRSKVYEERAAKETENKEVVAEPVEKRKERSASEASEADGHHTLKVCPQCDKRVVNMNVHMQKKHTINIIDEEQEQTEEASFAEDEGEEAEKDAEASFAEGEGEEAEKDAEASFAEGEVEEAEKDAEASFAEGEGDEAAKETEKDAEASFAKDPEEDAETEASVAQDPEEDAETEASFAKEVETEATQKGSLVMVKQSTIFWPALVMETTPTRLEVQVLNTNKTIKSVLKEDVRPFVLDYSMTKGREKVSSMFSKHF